MKKFLWLLFCFSFLIFLFSCSKEPPEKKTTSEEAFSEQKTQESDLAVEAEPPATESAPPSSFAAPTTEHTHSFQVVSFSESTCNLEGRRVWSCSCGQTKEEILPLSEHDFGPSSCTEAALCRHCGTKGAVLGHSFRKNRCERCQKIISEPIFVLGKPLHFDQGFDSVLATLGRPTETILEGDLKSLVYASDPARLTVVQLDSYGLWGVFTFDPEAFFQIDGSFVSRTEFSGKPDPESEARYQEMSSCRIYGFFDQFGADLPYAMWMRYSECDYHYMADPRISADLRNQSRLSFYFVNALRALHQKAPFHWCELAADASVFYSQKMAQEDFFYHDGKYGARLTERGVLWHGCGENISQGYTSAYFVCDAYYNCLDHRNNLLSGDFQKFGAGFAIKEDGMGPLAVIGAQTFYY